MSRLSPPFVAVVLALCAISLATPVRGQGVINEAAVEVTLAIDRAAIEPGTPINFTITVRNPGAQPVMLTFASTQRYDLVLRSRGVEIGRWSTNRSFAMTVEIVTVQPRQSITFTDTWLPNTSLFPLSVPTNLITMQPLAGGVYTLFAELTTVSSRPSSAAQTLIVGSSLQLNAGCQPLEMRYGVALPIELMIRTIEPLSELAGLWRYFPARNTYQGYQPGPLTPDDLDAIGDGETVIVCMKAPGRILMPTG